MKLKIEPGIKYNRWTVLKQAGKDKFRNIIWLCRCECGQERNVRGIYLLDNRSVSCGCYKNELIANRSLKHGATVNRTPLPEYTIWVGIKDRCYNPDCSSYKHYGGRGITMCDRWFNSFECFYNDMGLRPSAQHSIDRINNDGNYQLDNCKWALAEEQSRNKRNNRWIEFNGENMVLADWAKKFKATSANVRQHLEKKTFGETYIYYQNKLGKL